MRGDIARIIASCVYLIHVPFMFLTPALGAALTPSVAVPALLAEVWMVSALLTWGVKIPSAGTGTLARE